MNTPVNTPSTRMMPTPTDQSQAGLTAALRSVSQADTQDLATVLSDVINTDIAAMKSLRGNTSYTPQDAARLARVFHEYARMQPSIS